jgi:hypothetical protein
MNNTRKTTKITYNNETMSLKQWCEKLDLNYVAVSQRICRSKWSAEKAFNTPIIKQTAITYNGQTKTIAEWARIIGINYQTLQFRLQDAKWPIERALTTKLTPASITH